MNTRAHTIALMAAHIHATDRAACITVWDQMLEQSTRDALTLDECVQRAIDLSDIVERRLKVVSDV